MPQQALALANGPTAIEQSRLLAKQLSANNEEATAFIRSAFESVLCRTCTPQELAACETFLGTQATLLSTPAELREFNSKETVRIPPATNPAERARENLVHVLINHNDFITVR